MTIILVRLGSAHLGNDRRLQGAETADLLLHRQKRLVTLGAGQEPEIIRIRPTDTPTDTPAVTRITIIVAVTIIVAERCRRHCLHPFLSDTPACADKHATGLNYKL